MRAYQIAIPVKFQIVMRTPLVLLALLPAFAYSDQVDETHWTVSAGAVYGQLFLGTNDIRRGGIYGLEYAKPEKRFFYRNHKAQLAVEGYYMYTKGQGFDGKPVNHAHTYGLLALARYWNRDERNLPTFLELGFGLEYTNIVTDDLDSKLSTTPVVGVGTVARCCGKDLVFGLRWYHASNGGTVGSNHGTNQFHFTVGYRF